MQQINDGVNITEKDSLISIKLEGESRPFPGLPELLEGVLKTTRGKGLTIDGAVRTGACFYQVRAGSFRQTARIVEALHNQPLLTWSISARKQGEREPMYVVLNAPFQITNMDINTALSTYGEVKNVREQKFRQWPSISNGHRSVSFVKVRVPLPGNIRIKGINLIVRAYGDNGGGSQNKHCHVCGEEGHFKARCPRIREQQKATVAPTTAREQKQQRVDPVTEAPQVADIETNTVARQVEGGVRPGNGSPDQQANRSVERDQSRGQVEGNGAHPLPPPTPEREQTTATTSAAHPKRADTPNHSR